MGILSGILGGGGGGNSSTAANQTTHSSTGDNAPNTSGQSNAVNTGQEQINMSGSTLRIAPQASGPGGTASNLENSSNSDVAGSNSTVSRVSGSNNTISYSTDQEIVSRALDSADLASTALADALRQQTVNQLAAAGGTVTTTAPAPSGIFAGDGIPGASTTTETTTTTTGSKISYWIIGAVVLIAGGVLWLMSGRRR